MKHWADDEQNLMPGDDWNNDDLQLPSGGKFDEKLKKDFVALAKKEGISKKTATKLIEFAEKRWLKQMMDDAYSARDGEHESWAAQSEKDLGSDKERILAEAAKGLEKVDKDGSLAEDLRNTGLGNKATWIRLFASLSGKPSGSKDNGKEQTFLAGVYPTMDGKQDKKLYSTMK